MADIIDFTSYRLAQTQPPKTLSDLAEGAIAFLLSDWGKMSKNNRLNDYFKASLPSLVDQASKANFMGDLNEIAAIELNIGFSPIILSPGTMYPKQTGWIVQCKLNEALLQTPEFISEPHARCFALLMYLKVKRDALQSGVL